MGKNTGNLINATDASIVAWLTSQETKTPNSVGTQKTQTADSSVTIDEPQKLTPGYSAMQRLQELNEKSMVSTPKSTYSIQNNSSLNLTPEMGSTVPRLLNLWENTEQNAISPDMSIDELRKQPIPNIFDIPAEMLDLSEPSNQHVTQQAEYLKSQIKDIGKNILKLNTLYQNQIFGEPFQTV